MLRKRFSPFDTPLKQSASIIKSCFLIQETNIAFDSCQRRQINLWLLLTVLLVALDAFDALHNPRLALRVFGLNTGFRVYFYFSQDRFTVVAVMLGTRVESGYVLEHVEKEREWRKRRKQVQIFTSSIWRGVESHR